MYGVYDMLFLKFVDVCYGSWFFVLFVMWIGWIFWLVGVIDL